MAVSKNEIVVAQRTLKSEDERVPRPGTKGAGASTHAPTSGTSRAQRERPRALHNTSEAPRRPDRPRLAQNINGFSGRGFPARTTPLAASAVTSPLPVKDVIEVIPRFTCRGLPMIRC